MNLLSNRVLAARFVRDQLDSMLRLNIRPGATLTEITCYNFITEVRPCNSRPAFYVRIGNSNIDHEIDFSDVVSIVVRGRKIGKRPQFNVFHVTGGKAVELFLSERARTFKIYRFV